MTLWEEYARGIERDLAEIRKSLAPLELGEMRLGERSGTGPWRDVTRDMIAHHKRTIATYESILTVMKKRGDIP
jgi:hypothetical protein